MNLKNQDQPLVSVGMPIFNGAETLTKALDSVLEQDYQNLEIIISDNASTDTTPEICKTYVQKDSRIKYSRLKNNFGVVGNFNRTFELSSGKYFIWAACDDTIEQSLVRECVEKMEQYPEAVLCYFYSAAYLGQGGPKVYSLGSDGLENIEGIVKRYEAILSCHPDTALYGLFRSSAVRKTKVFQAVLGGEKIFLLELIIYGGFVQVPRVLFHYQMREKWFTVDQTYYHYFGKTKKPWWYLPFIVLFFGIWKRLICSPIPLSMKCRLSSILIKHEAIQVALKILIKLTGKICPNRWKKKLGCRIFWRWMHQHTMQVDNDDLYFERIIKPRLGWWSK